MAKRRNTQPNRSAVEAAAQPSRQTFALTTHAVYARVIVGFLIIAGAAVLTFFGLGHYTLWDDEATTALSAIGVWRTGDTSAVIDHNIVAFEDGFELRDLHFRYMPPLPSYLAAPFVGLMGATSLAARLPFALAGFAAVVVLVWWLWRGRADLLTWGLVGLATLGNVSLFLFFRQCRYYSVAVILSVAMAYVYLRWNDFRRPAIIFSILSIALLASNYLNYVALYACWIVDYLLWQRRHKPLAWREWLTVFLPQLVIGIPLLMIWNPVRQAVQHAASNGVLNFIAGKAILLYMNLRDLDQCEFGVTLLVILLPLAYVFDRDLWVLRGFVALLVYIFAVTAASPQLVDPTMGAAVRYLVPIIPLAIFLATAVIKSICRGRWWLAIPFAVIAFGTNALQIYPYLKIPRPNLPFYNNDFRSTIFLYLGELRDFRNDPFKETAKWLNENVTPRSSALVLPDYMNYPLMYHAPNTIYAWQISTPAQTQFRSLDPIHFRGVVLPDYLIAFGRFPDVDEFLKSAHARGVEYQPSATLDIFWFWSHRPELIWRSFDPIPHFDRKLDAIYVFRRVSGALTPLKKND
jgi:hypothetical protein